jgi:predicted small metal-binding protein
VPLSFSCRDAGIDCDWTTTADSERRLFENLQPHARAVHDMDPTTASPEQIASVKDAIKQS